MTYWNPDRLAMERAIARSAFLWTIQRIENAAIPSLGKGEGSRPVRVLAELQDILSLYLNCGWAWQLKYWQDLRWHVEFSRETKEKIKEETGEEIGGEFALRYGPLCDALLAWRARWNLLDQADDPWILNIALKTLKDWGEILQEVSNAGFESWVQEQYSISLPPTFPSIAERIYAEEIDLPDPGKNRYRQMQAGRMRTKGYALEVVGKRWGDRWARFSYPRGFNSHQHPVGEFTYSDPEAQIIAGIKAKKILPGLRRNRSGMGQDLWLRLLVLYQLETSQSMLSLATEGVVDMDYPRVNKAIVGTSNLIGLTHR